MTATHGNEINSSEDNAVFNVINSKLNSVVEIKKMVGKDYKTKILWANQCDIFIANAGTGCFVPLRICKKPGVLHSNSSVFSYPDDYPKTVKKIQDKHLIEIDHEVKNAPGFRSYHIPWQHIFNLSIEILNIIDNKTIKLLSVPPAESLIQGYEESKKAFFDLENKITGNYQSADILRDVATCFERLGDIHTASKIMEQAYYLRPKGPFIKSKLKEYRNKLSENNKYQKTHIIKSLKGIVTDFHLKRKASKESASKGSDSVETR